MKKILVVATTPPPYYGQSLMAEALIQAKFKNVKVYHVRMSFSKSIASIGKFGLHKILHMLQIVILTALARIRFDTPTLYYVPGGSSPAPVLRDIFILLLIRPLFSRIIFHHHAAGVSLIVENLPFLLKKLAKFVYRSSDASIHLSIRNPDCHYFSSKKIAIVPNGLEDDAFHFLPLNRTVGDKTVILFVGMVAESKGVSILLQAAMLLMKKHNIRVQYVGGFASLAYEREVYNFIDEHQLHKIVQFFGIQQGYDKWKFFAEADIFCFPSFYESESFGNVLVEAMMFELPVVATDWRGIPDVVQHNETGILVPVKDAQAVANALGLMIEAPEVRKKFGINGRTKFLNQYHRNRFVSSMEQLLDEVAIS